MNGFFFYCLGSVVFRKTNIFQLTIMRKGL